MRTCEIEGCERKYKAKGHCQSHYDLARNAAPRAPKKTNTPAPPGMKNCARCERPLPLSKFARQRGTKDSLGSWCRPCRSSYETARTRTWDEATRSRKRADQAAWKAANPEKTRAASHRRRARLRNVGGSSWTAADVAAKYEFQDGRCAYCSQPIALDDLHRDHFKALADGGTNDATNLVLSCGPCNLSKGKKRYGSEWRGPKPLWFLDGCSLEAADPHACTTNPRLTGAVRKENVQ